MGYCYEKGIPHSTFLEWDPEDRAKVLAYAMEQSSRCVSCGTAAWEWAENRFAYTPLDEHCPGCYQKSVFQESMGSSMPGTSVKLVPTTPLLVAQSTVNAKRRALREKKE